MTYLLEERRNTTTMRKASKYACKAVYFEKRLEGATLLANKNYT